MIQASHRRWHEACGKRYEPLPALGELPHLTALSLACRRLVDVKPVLMVVNTRAWCVVGIRVAIGTNPGSILAEQQTIKTEAER